MADRSQYFASADDWPPHMLDEWRWLIGGQQFSIVAVTAMGSVFVADEEGIVQFLDTTEGQFTRVAESREKFESLFDSADNRRWLLWSFFVRELLHDGVVLRKGQCYGWKVLPVLGGEPDFDNVDPTDVPAYVAMQGQLHQQARSLPGGTRVAEVQVDPPRPSIWDRLLRRLGGK